MSIETKIDELIEERAKWLMKPNIPAALAKNFLLNILDYKKTITLAKKLESFDEKDILNFMGKYVSKNVTYKGLNHVPVTGGALIVSNHPTGIADGLILNFLVSKKRQDSYLLANRDVLRIFPQLKNRIAPVEWRSEKRCFSDSRDTLFFLNNAIKTNRIGLAFPSGRIAKRRGLDLEERHWTNSIAILSKKYNLPIIPVHIKARNSILFYLFDLIHPSLRDITLFYETLNKSKEHFNIKIGEAIRPQSLDHDSFKATAHIKQTVFNLGKSKDLLTKHHFFETKLLYKFWS
ncbi:MAG: hypothetical protein CBD02_00100 [Candidatus Pelagibacter sp. TMED142]|nr:MAG: hypothetical protein CBD02_00100 [Candidatus Pelagibacter sp. TMED142]